MGILLYFIAVRLFLFLIAINLCVVLWKKKKEKGYLKVINEYFFEEAVRLDIYANASFRTLWNVGLRKRNGYNFGKDKETISSALGKNQRDGYLSWLGWIIVYILWALDYKYWFTGGHCINSIRE